MLDYGRRQSWLKLVFSLRGSTLLRIRFRLVAVALVSLLLTISHEHGYLETPLTLQALTLTGLALGIFLGFRNNTAYDRFWEGRRIWGAITNVSRTFTRDTLTALARDEDGLPSEVQRRQAHRLLAFVHALRAALRDQTDIEALRPYLSDGDRQALTGHQNVPNAILLLLSDEHRRLRAAGQLSEFWSVQLANHLASLTDAQGGCERIQTTPIPHSYSILIHSIVALYVFALPFGLVVDLHYFTPIMVLMVAYTFLGLDAVGDELEDPFGEDLNDLALTTISRNIEINVRQALGEREVPPPIRPDRGFYP
jgi:putative membrane protein